jgi:hypothetical protein
VIYYASSFNGASYSVFVKFESPAMSKAAITAPNEDVQQHFLSTNSLQLIKTNS